MAFTRKFLEALGIEEKQVEEIIASHSEVVTALKEQRDAYKAEADKLPAVQKELDELKNREPDGNEEKLKELQSKYNKLDKDFKDYKSGIEAKETKTAKEAAKKALLKESGVADKYIDLIMKASAHDLDGLELDDGGKIKDVDKVKETGLTPAFTKENVPYFEEARLVLVCRKMYAQDLNAKSVIDSDVFRCYGEDDYHRMYVSEIVKVLKR